MILNIEIKRFIFIGLISTLINYLVYFFSIKITSNISLSSFLGYSLGLINSFIFGKNFVFNNLSKMSPKLITKFLFVYFIGGFGMTFIITFLSRFNFNYQLSWILGVTFSFINNFLGSKLFVFNSKN